MSWSSTNDKKLWKVINLFTGWNWNLLTALTWIFMSSIKTYSKEMSCLKKLSGIRKWGRFIDSLGHITSSQKTHTFQELQHLHIFSCIQNLSCTTPNSRNSTAYIIVNLYKTNIMLSKEWVAKTWKEKPQWHFLEPVCHIISQKWILSVLVFEAIIPSSVILLSLDETQPVVSVISCSINKKCLFTT